MTTDVAPAPRHRVRVWYGGTPICDLTQDKPLADRYAEAMRRRFRSLRVTNEPVSPRTDE